ncbi:MAG: hypothetical protein R8L07_20105 [Alphaproteobacteria bacterium]|nr:hypothetical protein [Alphaproteobacteria bacterium]
MILRFETALRALWLMTDRRDAAAVEPHGHGWTERWQRLDRETAHRLLSAQPDRQSTLREIRRALAFYDGSGVSRLSDDDAMAALSRHFDFGWAVEIDRILPSGGWQGEDDSDSAIIVTDAVEPEENPTGVPAKKEKDHFIIVELVGENGEPIPNELCRITLPDGEIVERETNSQGKVEEYGIEEGDCTIEFPDLDKDAWEPYQAAAQGAAA